MKVQKKYYVGSAVMNITINGTNCATFDYSKVKLDIAKRPSFP